MSKTDDAQSQFENAVKAAVNGKSQITVRELAIAINAEQTRSSFTRIGMILKLNGWKITLRRTTEGTQRVYVASPSNSNGAA